MTAITGNNNIDLTTEKRVVNLEHTKLESSHHHFLYLGLDQVEQNDSSIVSKIEEIEHFLIFEDNIVQFEWCDIWYENPFVVKLFIVGGRQTS